MSRLEIALTIVREHWRSLLVGLTVLGAFVAGYRVGERKCTEVLSKRTIETSNKTDKTVQVVQHIQQTSDKSNETSVHTVIHRRKVTRPTAAGPVVTETETIERGKTSETKKTSEISEDSHGTAVTSSVSQTKTVELFKPPPRWRFGIGGGYQFSPARPGFVYGAEVDYRVFQSIPFMVGGRVYVGPGNVTGILALSLNI